MSIKGNINREGKLSNKLSDMKFYLFILVGTLLILPSVMAYSLAFPMMDLWTLFVENIFGSFWIAVLFIAAIFFVILMLADVSYFTCLLFIAYFFIAMSLGYGLTVVAVIFTIGGIIYALSQTLFKFLLNP